MLLIGRQKLAPQLSLRDQVGLSHFRPEGCWSGSVMATGNLLSTKEKNPRKKVAFSSTNGQEVLRMDANEPLLVGIRSVVFS